MAIVNELMFYFVPIMTEKRVHGLVFPLSLILCLFCNPSYALATNNAFPYTKHGGGTTDGETPCAGGVNRGLGIDYGGDCTTAGTTNAYNSANAEAGRYNSGECNHCHELHTSFGGSEPAPNTASPGSQDYLLFYYPQSGGTYISLCTYCHNNMSNISGSGSALGTGRYGFYQGGNPVYTASSHYVNNTNMYWPGTTGDPVDIYPRRSRATKPTPNKGSCLNCHTPHGIKETPGLEFDTAAVPAAKHLASANPNMSVDYLIPRQLIAWEENLCENCHKPVGSGGTGAPDIQTEINKRTTGSGHPVDDTALAGRHTTGETTLVTSKHVECYDCHNPHAAKTPTGVLGDGDGGRLQGMKYVDIDGVAQNPPAVGGTRQPFIYEICFRCHGDTYNQVFAGDTPFPDVATNRSSGGGGWTAYDKHFSNKRKEFDPKSRHNSNYPKGWDFGYNTSYHPVAAPGLNRTAALCSQLQNAFGLSCADPVTDLGNLTINCTDCHNSDDTAPAVTNPVTVRGPVTESSLRSTDKASTYSPSASPVGPHGSARTKLLRGNYVTTNSNSGTLDGMAGIPQWYYNNRLDTNGRPKFELCFFCHEESRLVGSSGGGVGSSTNFGSGGFGPGGFDDGRAWNSNLHFYHLNAGAVCHDCHHNVHSNVEAQNTIYGNGLGSHLPFDAEDGLADGKVNTHLVNFGPQASGHVASKPRWYFAQQASQWRMYKCNLICHGKTMSMCAYSHGSAEGEWWGASANWCGENS